MVDFAEDLEEIRENAIFVARLKEKLGHDQNQFVFKKTEKLGEFSEASQTQRENEA